HCRSQPTSAFSEQSSPTDKTGQLPAHAAPNRGHPTSVMAVNPTVAALMSEWVSPPSSPAHHEDSFMTAATEDDDMGMMATPEQSEKHPRGKKRGRGDDANGNNPIGKIRHLKKNDGEPLWRKDIQFDFLRAVFDNDAKEFTNSYEKDRLGKQCFA